MLKKIGVVNAIIYFMVWLASLYLLVTVGAAGRKIALGIFYLDALSALMVFTTATIVLAAAVYSISFIDTDRRLGKFNHSRGLVYYLLFNLFSLSMFLVPLVNNLGLLWVAIELTTLVSSFLVGFYNTKHAVEAAWKYLIICSVGITFALFGTIVFAYALNISTSTNSFNWTDLLAHAGKLDPALVKAAFIFILIGYGTKAGLAPMHTWLPDAHSQAVSPISALLSGVLLKTSIYAILRFGIIAVKCTGWTFYPNLMLGFGLFSLAIAAFFIIVQKDIKRLLAYHSVEHLGIIALGIGLRSDLALFGALFHLFNHAVTKALMFFSAGKVTQTYDSHNMDELPGVSRVLPLTGLAMLIGALALIGFPPSSIFISELLILIAAFKSGNLPAAILFIFFLAVIGGAVLFHFGKVIFGRPPEKKLSSVEAPGLILVYLFLIVFIIGLGIYVPGVFRQCLLSAVEVLKGN